MRDDMFAAKEHALQIDIHQPIPFLDAHLGYVSEEMDARVVHQDVDSPERRYRLFRQTAGGILVCDVAGNRAVAVRADLAATLSSDCASISLSMSNAPSRANSIAVARPIPLPAPVTIAILSLSRIA
jgi:hypothetical protein